MLHNICSFLPALSLSVTHHIACSSRANSIGHNYQITSSIYLQYSLSSHHLSTLIGHYVQWFRWPHTFLLMCFELASLSHCVNVRVFKYIDGQHWHVKKCDLTPSINSCTLNPTQVFPMKRACCSLVNNDSTYTESESTLMWDICHDGKHWCSWASLCKKGGWMGHICRKKNEKMVAEKKLMNTGGDDKVGW